MNAERNIETRVRDAYANRRGPERLRALAALTWRVILSTAALIAGLALCYGAFQLFSVLRGSDASGVGSAIGQSAALLDQKQLEGALTAFDARGNRFEALKTNAPTIPDPFN